MEPMPNPERPRPPEYGLRRIFAATFVVQISSQSAEDVDVAHRSRFTAGPESGVLVCDPADLGQVINPVESGV
jgi:hypothetical protein